MKLDHPIDDCLKDAVEEFLPRCIAFFNRMPIESLKIRSLSAVHLGKKFLAPIFIAIVYCVDNSCFPSVGTIRCCFGLLYNTIPLVSKVAYE